MKLISCFCRALCILTLWLSWLTRRLALRLQVRIPRGLFCSVVKFDFEIDCRHFVFFVSVTQLLQVEHPIYIYACTKKGIILENLHTQRVKALLFTYKRCG